jgi:XTP/dITP diphosphohydrolase
MAKVLNLLENSTNRKACFRTVIALMLGEKTEFFEGKIDGEIALKSIGESGFGYDPIFIPDGFDRSFAQLSAKQKNTISHRALAVKKLTEYLKKVNSK